MYAASELVNKLVHVCKQVIDLVDHVCKQVIDHLYMPAFVTITRSKARLYRLHKNELYMSARYFTFNLLYLVTWKRLL